MTFNDLRYIVVIAEENSITKAADKLYMTQPALSQYLKKVEKELGVLIFERTTTGSFSVKYPQEIPVLNL